MPAKDRLELMEERMNNIDGNSQDNSLLPSNKQEPSQNTEENSGIKIGQTAGKTVENQDYGNITGNKQGYSPNAEGKANTGSGVEAAVGTDYSWNKQAGSQAKNAYDTDVLNKKQEMLNNRQTLETNAVNYQAQADMMKYQNNQEAEKVGWTGGYVLDQNRQMEYLKSSIQAQMYGAMELQKYGYDSALAAARLAYDTNQQEYARQYYQEAVTAALSEAQLTGTYFSAEVKDMMSQRAVAEQKLRENPNDEQAKKVMDQIDAWFDTNNISKAGVKTLEAWQQDQTNELQWSNELWTRYQAALESANTKLAENNNEFILLDENGKEVWDGNNVTVGNWDSWSKQEVTDYLFSGKDGALNTQAVQQYYSYLDSTLVGETEAGFNKWCEGKGYVAKDENGNQVIKAGDFTNLFQQFLSSSGIIENLKKQFDGVEMDEKQAQKLYDIFTNWDFRFQMPDGSYKEYSYEELQKIKYEGGSGSGEPGSTITKEQDDGKGGKETVVVKDFAGNELKSYTFTEPNKTQYGDYKSTLSTGSQVCLTTATWNGSMSVNTGGLKDMDIGVDFGNRTGSSAEHGYNVEIDSDNPALAGVTNEINSMIYKATGEPPKCGQIITTGEVAYVYMLPVTNFKNAEQVANAGITKASYAASTSEYTAGWYPIKGQCGGSRKGNDLITALKDSGMVV